jgi:hypothetical protein
VNQVNKINKDSGGSWKDGTVDEGNQPGSKFGMTALSLHDDIRPGTFAGMNY